MNNVFADGLANVRFIDGVVRADLVTTSAVNKDESPRLDKTGSIMLSLPALVRIQSQLTDVIDRLVKDGVLKKPDIAKDSI